MTEQPAASNNLSALRAWLLVVAAMIFLTLVVGGATRLTESGLSITEWKPVTGILPPLSDAAWQAEFKAYQAIPQYQERNRGMSLDAFKVIYWWEWTHRLLARSTGAVFLLPFLFFLWRGDVPARLRMRLWAIFAGGAALGAVGWWMVASGLAGSGRVSVSQYRLAFHLTLATAIYAAVLWTAQQVSPQRPIDAPARLRFGALAIAVLVLAQIYLGALVAGLDAGLVYNTWPLIDGAFVPRQRASLVPAAGLAQFLREHAHRSVRPPHAGLSDLARRYVARQRRLACAARGGWRAHPGGRGDAAGRARYRHAAQSGAD